MPVLNESMAICICLFANQIAWSVGSIVTPLQAHPTCKVNLVRYSQSESWVHWAHCHPLSSTPNLLYYRPSILMVVLRVQVSVSTNGKELCSGRGAIIHLGLIARRFDPSVLPSAFSGRDHAAVRGTNTERARNRPHGAVSRSQTSFK